MRTVRRSPPGPSRWAYRARRTWAKPWLRSFVKGYLPVILLGLAGWAVVSNDRARLAIAEAGTALVERLAARPEFAVTGVEIVGASPALAAEIREITGQLTGASSLSLDLAALREAVLALPAVAEASAVFDPGGTLRIEVVRRDPVALWRDGAGRLALIDRQGVRVREAAARISYPDLPLLLGTGAPEAAGEGLRLLDAAADLRPRLRALVRVGERRWDIVLDGDLTVMLPAQNPLGALRGVMALDDSLGLLSRDLVAVDLRVRQRPVLRIAPGAAEDMVLRRAVGMAVGEDT